MTPPGIVWRVLEGLGVSMRVPSPEVWVCRPSLSIATPASCQLMGSHWQMWCKRPRNLALRAIKAWARQGWGEGTGGERRGAEGRKKLKGEGKWEMSKW